MRAGEAAAAAGVTVKALRYYESLGLLQPQRRPNGYRTYRIEDVRIATEIRRLSALGLSTHEVAPFLRCLDSGHQAGDDCVESIDAYRRKLDELDDAIARLADARTDLHRRLKFAVHRRLTSSASFGPPACSSSEEKLLIDVELPAGGTEGSAPALTRGFAACLASAVEVPMGELPLPDRDLGQALGTWRTWLAERGSGLVPIADPHRFQWAGWWIAVVRSDTDAGDGTDEGVEGGQVAVLAFGTPPGVVLSPQAPALLGRATADLSITTAHVIASLDPVLQPMTSAPLEQGTVEALAVAPAAEAPMRLVAAARAHAGRGLDGDRYASGSGTFSPRAGRRPGYDLTLVAAEVLDELAAAGHAIDFSATRRNVLTRGIDVNALVGHTFTIGDVLCRGSRLCEPCAHLERLNGPGLLRPLIHRGGLRVDVLDDGEITLGAAIRRLE